MNYIYNKLLHSLYRNQQVFGLSMSLLSWGVKKLIKLKTIINSINITVDIAAILSKLKSGLCSMYGQYKRTGKINAIMGLTVLPTIVIAVPMSGTKSAKQQQKFASKNVTNTFSRVVILLPLKNSSSIEFLHGIMQIGNPEATQNTRAMLPIWIIFWLLYPDAWRTFSLQSWPGSCINVAYPKTPAKKKLEMITILAAEIIFDIWFGFLCSSSS